MKPRILILHATGSNRDRDVAWACELAGGTPEIVHMNQILAGDRRLLDYQMLVLPGGFSYGDDLGAGKVWAVALRYRLAEDLAEFVATGRPVLGICNGFQVLVKAGLLPGTWPASHGESPDTGHGLGEQVVTLTRNASARFECRWVYLRSQADSPCIFTQGLTELVYCPVAHGEGRFVARDAATLAALEAHHLVALRYVGPDGAPAGYPWNPNGSQAGIAGICNPAGNVLGLMPHPENHVIPAHHPRFQRGEQGLSGLPLFRNAIRYAANG